MGASLFPGPVHALVGRLAAALEDDERLLVICRDNPREEDADRIVALEAARSEDAEVLRNVVLRRLIEIERVERRRKQLGVGSLALAEIDQLIRDIDTGAIIKKAAPV